jgi:V/A-type H+-transporting ATPase subunit K
MGVSAIFQGKAAASSCVAYAETGKGFANNLMILGIIETVAIFALVFCLLAMPSGTKKLVDAARAKAAVEQPAQK